VAGRESGGQAERIDRRVIAIVLGIAVFLALYTGFRLPSAWCATLEAVSLTDGFHRRFVVGTLLRPAAIATDYNYVVFASFSYLVLIGVLAVLVRATLKAEQLERKLLIIAWLVLPTGGFLFNEVGYFEQLLYLLLFAAMWLVNRDKLWPAVAVMAIAPCVHEIAILTVIPLFGLILLRTIAPKQAVLATAIPAVVNLIVLAISPASPGALVSVVGPLAQANFHYRPDALILFQRSQAENWSLYSVHEVVVYVRPIAYVLIALFAALWFSDRSSWRTDRDRLPAWLLLVASIAAIAVPTLLVYGGWDGNRWRFLVITNFCFVIWLALGNRNRAPLRAGTIAVLVLSLLVLSRIDIWYFDRLAPREIGYRSLAKFFHDMGDGSLFHMASE
jgi:hypothetical protein